MPIDRNQVEPKLLITTTIHSRIPIQKLLNVKTLILSYVPLGGSESLASIKDQHACAVCTTEAVLNTIQIACMCRQIPVACPIKRRDTHTRPARGFGPSAIRNS